MSENSKNWGFQKTWFSIKSHKKNSKASPSLWKIQIWNKLQLLQEFEVKENFPKFPIFRFWVQGKIFASVHFCRFWILSYNNCRNFKWEKTFRDFLVFYFVYRAKFKTQKLCKFSIFLLKAYLDFWPFISVNLLSFLELKLQLLPKFEVKERFPRFPSFRFCPIFKIESLETLESFRLLQIFFVFTKLSTGKV